jgi:hypothetical protein
MADENPGGDSFVVLELFTSQGCSSCPPADVLLREIAERAQREKLPFYPLSFHVDYWNSLGWTDPYSGKGATERQYEYSKALKTGRVYTPQLIVNGAEGFVGSNRSEMERAIRIFRSRKNSSSLRIRLEEKTPHKLTVNYNVSNPEKNVLLRIAVVERLAKNYVPRGENSGSTLSHSNVVRAFHSAAVTPSGNGSLELAVPANIAPGNFLIVAFLQNPSSMTISAAASLTPLILRLPRESRLPPQD